jgi:nucleoid DNA-binding protein
MDKRELAERLARKARLPKPVAADQLDRVVHGILRSLRKGQRVTLPGLGTFVPGKKPTFRFEPARSGKSARSGRK